MSRKTKTETGTVFVPQPEIKYAKSGVYIGSFGAGPCVLSAIYHPNLGILFGHIDALTTNEKMEKYLKIFIKLADNKEIGSSELNVIFTNSGEKDNAVLRKRIIEVFNKKGITKKPMLIDSTQLIVKVTNTVSIITNFVPKQRFPNASKNIDKLAEEYLNRSKRGREKADKYLKKYGKLPPRPTWGDKYAWWFNYNLEKWVL
tara:strand:- start:725 stop:1330 length:606 start_codon:yes stop_codon:yes gene_type:complete